MDLRAERHGGNRLHATQYVYVVGAAKMHCCDDRRMRPTLERRRAGNDAFHPCDLGGDDRHVRASHHRIAAARDVAADRIDRDVAMAEHDAGQGFDLEVEHGFALLLCEIPDLRLRELDVLDIPLWHLRDGALDLGGREVEILRRPLVEFLRQLADRVVLALLDLGEDGFHGLAHFRVGGLDRACVHSALQIASHGSILRLPRDGSADCGLQCAVVLRPASTQRMPPRGSATSPV